MSAAITALIAQGRFDRQFDLVQEHWTAVRRLWLGDSEFPDVGKFRSSLPDDFALGCGMPGLGTIKPLDDGRFEFAEGTVTAVIIPAYDGIPGNLDANPQRHLDHLVDLVAVDLDHPDRCWRRRGEALVLGAAYLEIAGETCEPVPVFKNPMTWLRAAGAGVCILDWDFARDLLLDHELVAEDLDLGAALEETLEPHIWIRGAAA